MGHAFAAVLQSLKIFLRDNPREMVILSLSVDDSKGYAGKAERAFRNDFHGFEGLFYPRWIAGKASQSEITLGDVRGKAILVLDEPWAQSIVEVHKPGDFVGPGQDGFDAPSDDSPPTRDWDNILASVEANIKKAKNDKDRAQRYASNFRASDFGTYNPMDFHLRARDTTVRALSRDNLGVNGEYRIGMVYFDFYVLVPEQTLNIIRSNKNCGNVQR